MVAVAIRTDASTSAGTGHVMRCLALAEAMRDRGADVRFVCRGHEGNLAGLLADRRLPVLLLPAKEQPVLGEGGHADWLGATEEADAAATILALGGEQIDWLVVDHYGIGARWERALRGHVQRIVAIDDLADRAHDCDILLDQSYSHRDGRYASLVPAHCRLLCGPRYALLRSEFRQARAARPEQGTAAKSILVYFGGTDAADMTGRTLEALTGARFEGFRADVVLGVNNPHRASVERLARSRPATMLHSPTREIGRLMAEAVLAIGGGGITTWERLCVGVPSVVIAVAPNQVASCETLAANGIVDYLGTEEQVTVDALRAALGQCLASAQRLADRSRLGRTLVDGFGTARVAELLLPSAATSLTLRPAAADDMALYLHWVNDPESRRQSLRTAPVLPAEHESWFRAKLASSESRMFVMEARGLPVGQVRFDSGPEGIWISYSIDADFRGRGWAGCLVQLGLAGMEAYGPAEFRATVRASNPASEAVFRRLGFREISAADERTRRTYALRVGATGSTRHAN